MNMSCLFALSSRMNPLFLTMRICLQWNAHLGMSYMSARPNVLRLLAMFGALSISNTAFAVDASGSATEIMKSGRWFLIEFAAEQQLFYRIGSQATNLESSYIAFDFVPSEKCMPAPAVMHVIMNSYAPDLADGVVLMSYKLPGQPESTDATKTAMAPGDNVAFFQFHELTIELLQRSHDKGSVSIWVPESGDGTVKRSGNIFFSLSGFTNALNTATRRCNDNR